MSDKPKRWTWEEWNKETDAGFMPGTRSAFEVNEPYIEWLEEKLEWTSGELDKKYTSEPTQEQYDVLLAACEFYADNDRKAFDGGVDHGETAREALTKVKELEGKKL